MWHCMATTYTWLVMRRCFFFCWTSHAMWSIKYKFFSLLVYNWIVEPAGIWFQSSNHAFIQAFIPSLSSFCDLAACVLLLIHDMTIDDCSNSQLPIMLVQKKFTSNLPNQLARLTSVKKIIVRNQWHNDGGEYIAIVFAYGVGQAIEWGERGMILNFKVSLLFSYHINNVTRKEWIKKSIFLTYYLAPPPNPFQFFFWSNLLKRNFCLRHTKGQRKSSLVVTYIFFSRFHFSW